LELNEPQEFAEFCEMKWTPAIQIFKHEKVASLPSNAVSQYEIIPHTQNVIKAGVAFRDEIKDLLIAQTLTHLCAWQTRSGNYVREFEPAIVREA
jgi:hypothetical protein